MRKTRENNKNKISFTAAKIKINSRIQHNFRGIHRNFKSRGCGFIHTSKVGVESVKSRS